MVDSKSDCLLWHIERGRNFIGHPWSYTNPLHVENRYLQFSHAPFLFLCQAVSFVQSVWESFLQKRPDNYWFLGPFFAFLLFAYLFVLKLNETHNWAKAISLPVTSMFDGFLGDENSFILFHVIWFLICLFEVSFVYLLIHKITPTIKH